MASDAKELKIQSLKEVIARDKVAYEDQIANLRVELTLLSERSQEMAEQNEQLQQAVAAALPDTENEVVQGELVQESKAPRAKKPS